MKERERLRDAVCHTFMCTYMHNVTITSNKIFFYYLNDLMPRCRRAPGPRAAWSSNTLASVMFKFKKIYQKR